LFSCEDFPENGFVSLTNRPRFLGLEEISDRFRLRPQNPSRDGGADSAAFSERGFSDGLFPFLLFGNLLLNGREAAV